jgi:hypothetical protein
MQYSNIEEFFEVFENRLYLPYEWQWIDQNNWVELVKVKLYLNENIECHHMQIEWNGIQIQFKV